MKRFIYPLLEQAEIVYRTGRNEEDLAALALIFEEDLAGENRESIKAAFDMHRRASRFFPTPADILKALPYCRTRQRQPALADNRRANPDFVAKLRRHYERKWQGERAGCAAELLVDMARDAFSEQGEAV